MSGLLLSVWLCSLLCLQPLEIQSRDLRAHRHRLSASRNHKESSYPSFPSTVSDLSTTISNRIPQEDTPNIWRAPPHRDPHSKLADMLLHGSNNVLREVPVRQRWSRVVVMPMVVAQGPWSPDEGGCVLGTCQVQNLSHRLYQLVGQNGREDSSPLTPAAPTAMVNVTPLIQPDVFYWNLNVSGSFISIGPETEKSTARIVCKNG